MNLPDLETLDYSTLKELLATFADSPCGLLWINRLLPYRNRTETLDEYKKVEECIELLQKGQGLTFSGLTSCDDIFSKLGVEGTVLASAEILEIIKQLNHVLSTKNTLVRLAHEGTCLASIGKKLADFSELLGSLTGKISADGNLEDNASSGLKRIRNQMVTTRNRLYRMLEQLMRRHLSDHTIQDDVVTIRNERFVVPVRVENRKDLAGVVHGTSSSGATVFLEPLETLELNNSFVRLKEQEQEEVREILRQLTGRIRERLQELRYAIEQLGYLDFIFAKARFSRQFQAVIPEINEDGILRIDNGRHPILEMTLGGPHNIVPVSVKLDPDNLILVITGPNTGGKTVALKTVGLLALMALSAIPVPATSANICILSQVFADIGDHQSISENLSTFSSHLLNIRRILTQVCPPALVLLDELGTGTDPAEGAALAVAIVERFRGNGVLTAVTTHHNGLKMYAATTPGVTNASMEFDSKTLHPTFRLIQGIPGNSSGIDIAENLGLDPSLISHARSMVSDSEKQIALYSRHLMQEIGRIAKARSSLQKERQQIVIEKKALEAEYYQREERRSRELDIIKEKAIGKFEADARNLLGDIHDKYLAVRARREIEHKASKVRGSLVSDLTSYSKEGSELSKKAPISVLEPPLSFQVGDKVRVARYGQNGIVLATAGTGKWEVVIGNFKCLLDSAEMEIVEPSNLSATKQPVVDPGIRLSMQTPELTSNEINVIGCTADDAIECVDKFLDSALVSSIREVRLIHGSGMGILRRALSDWLANQPHVSEFHSAAPNQGGSGVTIVTLKI